MKTFFKIHYRTFITIFIVMIFGTINHFIYDFTNNNILLKPFVPIDESVFEHLKLIFYPIIIVSLIEGIILKKDLLSHIASRNIGAIFSCILLSIFFVIYTGNNIDNHNPIIDISSYYISIIIAFFISEHLLNKFKNDYRFIIFSLLLLFISIILFTYFTINKPDFIIFNLPN